MTTGRDSRNALQALRADLNPHLYGVLWDLGDRWMATTPAGDVISAATADGLRRAVREADGTVAADTATLPRYQEDQ